MTGLHPELQEICADFVKECAEKGLIVGISQTWRSKDEQEALYAQGRTRPGSIVTNCRYPHSPHNWGVAFDIYRKDGRGAYEDGDGWFRKCGQIGKKMGLFWGGDFRSFPDQPHFELAHYLPQNSCRRLIAEYGTPERFKQTWEEYMTQERFNKMMDEYLARMAEKPVSAWAAAELTNAVEHGITDGKHPRAFATREEVAIMVLRGLQQGE